MKALCRICDMHPATHRATDPREPDPRYRTWLICDSCIRRSIAHSVDHDYEPLPEQETV